MIVTFTTLNKAEILGQHGMTQPPRVGDHVQLAGGMYSVAHVVWCPFDDIVVCAVTES